MAFSQRLSCHLYMFSSLGLQHRRCPKCSSTICPVIETGINNSMAVLQVYALCDYQCAVRFSGSIFGPCEQGLGRKELGI